MRDHYKQEIRKAKQTTWKHFIEEMDDRTIWTAKKYIDTVPTPHYIPTINDATSNEDKANVFAAIFFPPAPPANLHDISSTTTYPQQVRCISSITIQQIG